MDFTHFQPPNPSQLKGHPYVPDGQQEFLERREKIAKNVARFALMVMLVLFARTLLWVLDGIFYAPTQEIRLPSVIVFLCASVLLWKLLEFQSLARRHFISFCALCWSYSLGQFIRTYHEEVLFRSSLQVVEYCCFLLWAVLSSLLVVYLLQPHVRELFTQMKKGMGPRCLTVLASAGLFLWEAFSPSGVRPLDFSIKLYAKQRKELVSRFQGECVVQEVWRLPANVDQTAVSNFCRCDSRILAKHCPAGIVNRGQCLTHIQKTTFQVPRDKVKFLRAQEACIAQYFPKERRRIFSDRRKKLEGNIIRKLSFSLPLGEEHSLEHSQQRYLHCMTVSVLSRCDNPRLSSTYECLSRFSRLEMSEAVKKRCRRISSVKLDAYGKKVESFRELLAKEKYEESLKEANEAVALGPDRPEGYLGRGLIYFQTEKYKEAVEDFTIVLSLSDFSYTRSKALEYRGLSYQKMGKTDLYEVDASAACEMGDGRQCVSASATSKNETALNVDDVTEKVVFAYQQDADVLSIRPQDVYVKKLDSEKKVETDSPRKPSTEVKESTPEVKESPSPEAVASKSESAETPESPVEIVSTEKEEKPEAKEPQKASEEKAKEEKVEDASEPALTSARLVEGADDSKGDLAEATTQSQEEKVSELQRRKWNALIQVGEIALKTRDFAKAREKFVAARTLAERNKYPGDLWLGSQVKILSLLRSEQKYGEAVEALATAIPHWKHTSMEGAKPFLEEVGNLVALSKNGMDPLRMEVVLRDLWSEVSQSQSPLIRDLNLHLSAFFVGLGRGSEVEPLLVRELEILSSQFGEKDPRTVASRRQLSELYNSQGETQKAEAILSSPPRATTSKPGK